MSYKPQFWLVMLSCIPVYLLDADDLHSTTALASLRDMCQRNLASGCKAQCQRSDFGRVQKTSKRAAWSTRTTCE